MFMTKVLFQRIPLSWYLPRIIEPGYDIILGFINWTAFTEKIVAGSISLAIFR